MCATHRKILGDDWIVLHGICQSAVGPVLLLLAALPCRAAAPLLPPLGGPRLPRPPAFGRAGLLLLLRGRQRCGGAQCYPQRLALLLQLLLRSMAANRATHTSAGVDNIFALLLLQLLLRANTLRGQVAARSRQGTPQHAHHGVSTLPRRTHSMTSAHAQHDHSALTSAAAPSSLIWGLSFKSRSMRSGARPSRSAAASALAPALGRCGVEWKKCHQKRVARSHPTAAAACAAGARPMLLL